jgi:hypothetical protein
MNMAVDHETARASRVNEAFAGFPAAPDWRDLRSRLFAAHDVRTVLAGETAPVRLRTRGSFAGEAASLLNTYGLASSTVNLEISSNGKPGGAKVTSVAGTSEAGDRG